MKLTPIKQHFYADNITLNSGAKVSGNIITKSGKVYCTEGNIKVTTADEKSFTFTLVNTDVTPMPENANSECATWSAPYRTINSVPPGVSAEAVIDEFISFVENDIA